MKCIELEMSYRGSRNYLHGTDIYPSVMAAVERERTTRVEGPVSLMFKNFSDYQLDMFLFDPEEIPDKPTNAMVFFSIGDNDKSHGWLVKSTRPVKERRAFDEIAIDRQTLYTDKKASVQANLDLPPIDIIVPTTKHLHQRLLPAPGERWILSRLELPALFSPRDSVGIEVEMSQSFGARLTKSTVSSNGRFLGHIFFSRVPE